MSSSRVLSGVCLVLGGDGFIGSHLIDDLVARGYSVRAFSHFHNGVSFNLEHLKGKIEFFAGDFLNVSDLNKALNGVDYVFHMISLSTPGSTMNDPLLDIDTNIRGTVNLLNLCVRHNVKKIIFPSSGGTVYGETGEDFVSEFSITNPICPYGISKLTIEKYLDYFYRVHGLDYLVFRISNPYGERQNLIGNQGIVSIFLNLIRNNSHINVFGDGSNVRDYIYVKDVTSFISDVFSLFTNCKLYNLGSGRGISVNELIETIKTVTSKDVRVRYLDSRKVDVKRFVLDISRVKNEFNFHPKVDIIAGIGKTWEYIRSL